MMVSPTKNKMVKFRYSEKATKVENNLSPFFEIKIKTKIFFSNFCGLLRISELYLLCLCLILLAKEFHCCYFNAKVHSVTYAKFFLDVEFPILNIPPACIFWL